jgi:hypothetical protein
MKKKNLMVMIFVSICVLFLCQTGLASPLFYARMDFPAGDWPFSVAIGDVNGDGAPDLAVANCDSDNVSVLLGNGDGTFQTAVNYGTGGWPYSVAIGDVNGDDAPDLAVANCDSDNVSVLLGNGDGTFQTAVNYLAGHGPSSVAIDDVNGDGTPDLAVANCYSDNVSVLINVTELPIPDIKANGLDGPLFLTPSQNVNISISLDPGDMTGVLVDWWGILLSSYGNFPLFGFQAPLFELPDTSLFSRPWPVGWYIFVFGLDDVPDGAFELDWYDYVVVVSQSAGAEAEELPDFDAIVKEKLRELTGE